MLPLLGLPVFILVLYILIPYDDYIMVENHLLNLFQKKYRRISIRAVLKKVHFQAACLTCVYPQHMEYLFCNSIISCFSGEFEIVYKALG